LHNTILAPLAALVLWSFVMWAWLYATRIPAVTKGNIIYDGIDTLISDDQCMC
jgi:hypothetical protein